MVFWSEPTATKEEESEPTTLDTTPISEHDAALLDADTKDESDADGDESGEDESGGDSAAVTWADVDQLSAAVLASIPRTATAKLAAVAALVGYLVCITARLDKCVAHGGGGY